MSKRKQTDLLALAGRYANERKVSANTIAKEILHYDPSAVLTLTEGSTNRASAAALLATAATVA